MLHNIVPYTKREIDLITLSHLLGCISLLLEIARSAGGNTTLFEQVLGIVEILGSYRFPFLSFELIELLNIHGFMNILKKPVFLLHILKYGQIMYS